MIIRRIQNTLAAFIVAIVLPLQAQAHGKTIAITIDDLPFVGEYRNFHLNRIIAALKEKHVSATGFIIASEVRKDNWDVLNQFRKAGFGLGNHTLTHMNLNTAKTKEYIEELDKADSLLSSVLTKPKYFRYPYLAMGTGKKRDAILCHLNDLKYHVAPITVDTKDFYFNQRLLSVPESDRRHYLEELKPFYLDFIWQQTLRAQEYNEYHKQRKQSQILLIHSNLLNAYVLPDIIQLYKEKGYVFVPLKKALKSFKDIPHCSTTSIRKPFRYHSIDKAIAKFMDWD